MSEPEDEGVKRTKVSRACDYCKKRKFKCSGKSPCNLCTKKKLECVFSIIDRRTIRRKNKKRKIKKEVVKPVIDNQTLNLLTQKANIPSHYQPLLIFPLHNGINNANDITGGHKLMVKPEDPPKLIFDSQGNLRYFGETSPLSLLFECRAIFKDKLGESEFTTQGTCPIVDEPEESEDVVAPPPLPTRETFNRIFEVFLININQVCYVFDTNYFTKNTVEFVYADPTCANCPRDKISLINLVIGVGLKYAELCQDPIVAEFTHSAANYMEFGLDLANRYINKNKVWVSEAYSMAYYYYQAVQQRNTAWLMLGTAVRNAQALGLHRKFINDSFDDPGYRRHRRKLFKSLYVNDYIVSLLHGRPLHIDDYDYDDFDNEDIFEIDRDGNQIKSQKLLCLIETTKLYRITGKIIKNCYSHSDKMNGIIAEKLAIELKLWSVNLPPCIQIDKVVENTDSRTHHSIDTIRDAKIPLLLVHLSQLYAIILLCRPFFMYIIAVKAGKKKASKRMKSIEEIAICNFGKAAVKSSILVIQLVDYYVGYIQFLPMRVESYGVVHATFNAALIIGMSMLYYELNGSYDDPDYSRINSMGYLNTAKQVFQFYSDRNIMSQRFYDSIESMQSALMGKFGFDIHGNDKEVKQEVKQEVLKKFPMFNYDDFIDNFGALLPMTTMGQSVDQYLSESSTTSSLFENSVSQPLDMFMYGMGEININTLER
ncbi:uncharacterized protein SPAPADRAFT_131954 [Spathaspora passalidarum NRRL Y-27907]|uniref:Zn(2)-C6 fungal-type domain-containing protein n=1 Tax=Spathaspora passalidarum (strain NRRL Y-27907 / 11-Y1) TaxID=619300 RepID=G3AGQ4_SPAPN|nr:uncharacterized protein SPAPADRAFT_131954 [Spathaspora passalidarum NRRL Y-27907]EGW35387.1 hypothetical protein SPAPADRAFT_131954 [Spathaspora passalidarum NRRL Y-27907]